MYRIYSKVDMQIELELLAYNVPLPEGHRHEPVPRYEEVLALAQVVGLHHVVDARVFIEDQVLLQVAAGAREFLLEEVHRLHEAVFQEVLKYGSVDVFLGSGEIVKTLMLKASRT